LIEPGPRDQRRRPLEGRIPALVLYIVYIQLAEAGQPLGGIYPRGRQVFAVHDCTASADMLSAILCPLLSSNIMGPVMVM
jgi:hypothetical protein